MPVRQTSFQAEQSLLKCRPLKILSLASSMSLSLTTQCENNTRRETSSHSLLKCDLLMMRGNGASTREVYAHTTVSADPDASQISISVLIACSSSCPICSSSIKSIICANEINRLLIKRINKILYMSRCRENIAMCNSNDIGRRFPRSTNYTRR